MDKRIQELTQMVQVRLPEPEGKPNYYDISGTYQFDLASESAKVVVSVQPDGSAQLSYSGAVNMYTCDLEASASKSDIERSLASELPIPFTDSEGYQLNITFYSNGLVIERAFNKDDFSIFTPMCGMGASISVKNLFQKK
jgi:hypothetical protein